MTNKKLGPYGLPEIINLLGPPPPLRGEKSADFFCLVVALANDHQPVLASEWLLIHQIAVVTFQLQRFARAEAGLFTVYQSEEPSKTIVQLGDFKPRSAYDPHEPVRVEPPPKIIRVKGKERVATNSDLGTTLKQKIDVFERSQTIAGELERRRKRLLRQLTEMQLNRISPPHKIIDVTLEEG